MAAPENPKTSREATVQRIAEQQARIARQRVLIANLADKDLDVSSALNLLVVMEQALIALRVSLSHFPDKS